MATRHETTLSYKLDARGLRDARREIEKTFKPLAVKGMNDALKDMRGAVKALAAEQARLTTEMLKVDEGTEAYKKFAEQLEKVEKRALGFAKAIGAVEKARRGGPGEGAFSQGFLQGISPAAGAFIERGPGMRAQFAGQVVGSRVRGVGSRFAQGAGAMLAGAGPLSTVTAGIPGLGGISAMAEGAVAQAVEFQRARMGIMPFIAGGDFRGLAGARRRGAGVVDEEAVRAAARADFFASGKSVEAASAATADLAERAAERENPYRHQITRGLRGFGAADRAVDIVAAREARKADLRNVARRDVDLQQDLLEEEAQKASEEAVAEARRDSRRRGARAGARFMASRTAAFRATGSAAFLGPQEALAAAGELGRMTGGRLSSSAFEQAEAARVLHGIDRGTSGQLLRQLRPGRGGATSLGENLIASAIADAVAQGLEGSEINEHLADIAALQEAAAQQGLKIQAETLQGMGIALTRGAGLQGVRGLAVAGQFQAFGARVAGEGVRGPVDVQLLRALGFEAGGGPRSYISALEKAEQLGEGGLDAGGMFRFISNLTEGAGDARTAKLPLARALRQAGIRVSLSEAEQLARATQGGESGFARRLTDAGLATMQDGRLRITPGAERGATAASLSGALRSDDVQEWGRLIRQQIGIEERLLSAGQKNAGNVLKLQNTAASLADKLGDLAPTLTPIVQGISNLAKGVNVLVDMVVDMQARGTSFKTP